MSDFIVSFFVIIIIVILSMSFVANHFDNILDAKVQAVINNYAELISRQGEYSQTVLDDLKYELKKYGDYTVNNELKISLLNGEYDPFYDDVDIIDVPLKVGDKIVIKVLYNDISLYRRLKYSLPSVISQGGKAKVLDASCVILGN